MDYKIDLNQGGCDMNGILQDENLMMLRVYGSKFCGNLHGSGKQTAKKVSADNHTDLDFSKMLDDMIMGLSVAM